MISQVKLIAEPWDVGPGGYQVGNFPPLWSEWNGKYRDTVRDFWRGEPGTLGEFASRLMGSSDLYQADGRRPFASINFVTAHDGFTLDDLVSYNDKHNEANGEGGNDGESHNRSWNCGVEGPTDDAAVLELRARQQRNFIATLLLSQGVPMLLHGDELGRTQGGNNNVYCQDSELSWVDWSLAGKNASLIGFTAGVLALRHGHPVFRRRRFFAGRPIRARRQGDALPDIAWFTPSGQEMTEQDWDSGFGKCVVAFLNGDGITEPDSRGRAGHRRLVPALPERALRGHRADPAGAGVRLAVGDRGGHRGRRGDHAVHRRRGWWPRSHPVAGRRGAHRAGPVGAASCSAPRHERGMTDRRGTPPDLHRP